MSESGNTLPLDLDVIQTEALKVSGKIDDIKSVLACTLLLKFVKTFADNTKYDFSEMSAIVEKLKVGQKVSLAEWKKLLTMLQDHKNRELVFRFIQKHWEYFASQTTEIDNNQIIFTKPNAFFTSTMSGGPKFIWLDKFIEYVEDTMTPSRDEKVMVCRNNLENQLNHSSIDQESKQKVLDQINRLMRFVNEENVDIIDSISISDKWNINLEEYKDERYEVPSMGKSEQRNYDTIIEKLDNTIDWNLLEEQEGLILTISNFFIHLLGGVLVDWEAEGAFFYDALQKKAKPWSAFGYNRKGQKKCDERNMKYWTKQWNMADLVKKIYYILWYEISIPLQADTDGNIVCLDIGENSPGFVCYDKWLDIKNCLFVE